MIVTITVRVPDSRVTALRADAPEVRGLFEAEATDKLESCFIESAIARSIVPEVQAFHWEQEP